MDGRCGCGADGARRARHVSFVAGGSRLRAVRLRDGTTLWTSKLPHFSCHPPAVVRGSVVLSCTKKALAFDARTGRALWRMPTVTWTLEGGRERAAIAPPFGASGLVFVQDVTRGISALDPRNGRVVWSHPLAGSSSEPASASAGTIYVPSGTDPGPPSGWLGGTVVQAIDARTGAVRWTAPTKGNIPTPPVLAAGTVFVYTDNGWPSLAIDVGTGAIVRRFHRYGLQFPAASGGVLVAGVGVGARHQRVAAIRAKTGERLWVKRTPNGLGILTPTIIGGTAYVTSNQGGDLLYALDLATGRRRWMVHLNDIGGTTAGPGELLLVTAGLRLIAYRVG